MLQESRGLRSQNLERAFERIKFIACFCVKKDADPAATINAADVVDGAAFLPAPRDATALLTGHCEGACWTQREDCHGCGDSD